MGSVAMGEGGSWIFEGDTIHETAHCLYCDQCGSFNIQCHITLRAWEWLAIAMFTAGVVGWIQIKELSCLSVFVIVAFPFLLMHFFSSSFQHRTHICKKCGNTSITLDNVLNYPAYDRSILDVPYELTQKHYTEYP